jgi:hypothetical protein
MVVSLVGRHSDIFAKFSYRAEILAQITVLRFQRYISLLFLAQCFIFCNLTCEYVTSGFYSLIDRAQKQNSILCTCLYIMLPAKR